MSPPELPIAGLMISGALAAWPLLRERSLARAAVCWIVWLSIGAMLVGPTAALLCGSMVSAATAALLWPVCRRGRSRAAELCGERWINVAAAAGMSVVLPLLILDQHEEFLSRQAEEFLQAGRLGEAAAISRTRLTWFGDGLPPRNVLAAASGFLQPLNRWSDVVRVLEQEVKPLELEVRRLDRESTAIARLRRSRLLAVLGRRTAARQHLKDLQRHPVLARDAELLSGLLDQADERWIDSEGHFERAARLSRSAPPEMWNDGNPLKQALLGQAFAARKLGRFADAERALLAAVDLQPSAADHFLLAQFYEDAQRSDLAADHAQRARELAPSTYQGPSAALINRLATSHLGCWLLP